MTNMEFNKMSQLKVQLRYDETKKRRFIQAFETNVDISSS